ncbi:hypothetical protein VTN31DRAFT_2642 [Thermomyces dupontii]|uniref:uncharacterized protein n=1 Tax=Talaromyces thermophilus TaxID=28565 RepID=UPI0037433D6A
MAETDPDFQINVDLHVQEILLAASQHNIPRLHELIRTENPDSAENPVNVKDPETGSTPLHAAIAACEVDGDDDGDETNGATDSADKQAERERVIETARETVKFLLQEGAIWNDLDTNNETPGCIARRLGLTELYELLVDAGVRAEMLFNRLEGYEQLADDDEDGEEGGNGEEKEEKGMKENGHAEQSEAAPPTTTKDKDASTTTQTAETKEPAVTNGEYLQSNLTFQTDRILDADRNGVMMSWESEIMSRTAAKLLPEKGLRVLNIGHGMGIIDGFFQSHSPSEHHIVEAHPAVLEQMERTGWRDKPGVTIHAGKWQDVLPKLLEENRTFDAIYYDTFAESYADFRQYMSEYVIGLLDPSRGQWSFFNGMGADRQISYDVYQKVVELDAFEAGYDITWETIPVPKMDDRDWEGVRRKYWVVDSYRLPICRFMD